MSIVFNFMHYLIAQNRGLSSPERDHALLGTVDTGSFSIHHIPSKPPRAAPLFGAVLGLSKIPWHISGPEVSMCLLTARDLFTIAIFVLSSSLATGM
jgi:hypothetical protein